MTQTKTFDIAARDVVVQATAFADKIFVNILSHGKLGRVFSVPLRGSPSAGGFDPSSTVSRGVGNLSDAEYLKSQRYLDQDETPDHDYSLLPLNHFTPQPLLGAGTDSEDDIFARLLAVQIATLVSSHNPLDTRTLVVSLGPKLNQTEDTDSASDLFWDLLSAVGQCRVW